MQLTNPSMHRLKPIDISSLTGMALGEVYRAKHQVRKDYMFIGPNKPTIKAVTMLDNKPLLENIKKSIASIGISHATLSNVMAHLRSLNQLKTIPSKSTLRRILKERFGLSFRTANAANTKYNDTDFDPKRLWVSKLIT